VDFSFEKDTIGHIFKGQYYGLQYFCGYCKMCPIVSFSNEKSTTDQKKSPLRFIPSSDFIIENNCIIGHYLILQYQAKKVMKFRVLVDINGTALTEISLYNSICDY
jgi:hypothetical protein